MQMISLAWRQIVKRTWSWSQGSRHIAAYIAEHERDLGKRTWSRLQGSRHVAAYIDNQHCNGKGGLDHLHQEVDADGIKAECPFCIFAHVYKHRLQT